MTPPEKFVPLMNSKKCEKKREKKVREKKVKKKKSVSSMKQVAM
jgi:hypothetical protein